jgi:RecB family endonuclease NucS
MLSAPKEGLSVLPYTTTLRLGYVIDLFQKRQIFDDFKAAHWQYGDTPRGEAKTRFFLRVKERYENFLESGLEPAEVDDEEDDAGSEFAAEDDLRDFLAKNPGCIESGLRLYESEGRKGVEFSIENGRIDILALDKAGKPVVIELKVGKGRNKTLGQLLYYMGWVDKNLGRGPCRGMIIAKEIPDDLAIAVHRVSGVSLLRYSLSVSVEAVHAKP